MVNPWSGGAARRRGGARRAQISRKVLNPASTAPPARKALETVDLSFDDPSGEASFNADGERNNVSIQMLDAKKMTIDGDNNPG